MASGILAQRSLPADTLTEVYAAPANKVSSITVNAVATRLTTNINVGITTQTNINSLDPPPWIEYKSPLMNSGSVLERSGIVISNGEKLVAYSQFEGVIVTVYGFEENL